MATHIVFAINLLQDVNIVRPLVYLAAADFDVEIALLVSTTFLRLDEDGQWLAELRALGADVDAALLAYGSPYDAYAFLQDKAGLLVAGSESDLAPHAHVHEVFRTAPASFLKVTLQHGFECVGFLQNQEQSAAFGVDVGFAANVVCGWCDGSVLTALAPSERSKLYVTGPQLLLQSSPPIAIDAPVPGNGGIVCENLHSVRFGSEAGRQTSFMDEFEAFCGTMARRDRRVTLRPHPGGQYVVRNKFALPPNVALENEPIYRVPLTRFDYGISAPSTVLLDMLLAGVPVAVWNDPGGGMDSSNYEGLRTINGTKDWAAFEAAALRDPATFRRQQAKFLSRLKMPLDPSDVRTRFARLFAGAGAPVLLRTGPLRRLLFLSRHDDADLEASFLHPLRALRRQGKVEIARICGDDIMNGFADPVGADAAEWLVGQIVRFRPELIVVTRDDGPYLGAATAAAKRIGARILWHLADDPGDPDALNAADLLYCETPALADRLRERISGRASRIVAADIPCGHAVRRQPTARARGTIGYVASGRERELDNILPALIDVLRRNPDIRFELTGPIAKPAELDAFGDRIGVLPLLRDHAAAMARLATLDWDVGLCPLRAGMVDRFRSEALWAHYTSAGIAVVASAGGAYDGCCADGCGITAIDRLDWVAALETLCRDADARRRQVLAAQARLRRHYSPERMRDQVVAVLDAAMGAPLFGRGANIPDAPSPPAAPIKVAA